MGFFSIIKNTDNGGDIVNLELLEFIRSAFGKNIKKLPEISMSDFKINFLFVDNDLLITDGLSNYGVGERGKFFELMIRVPFKWQINDNSKRNRWIVEIMQDIVNEIVSNKISVDNNYVKIYNQPFYYTTELNCVTLYKTAEKTLQSGKTVNFMMLVPLYESELDDDYYKMESSDLKGLAWQRASLTRANEYFETLDDYYPYDNDTQAMEDYLALRDETLPGWNPDKNAVGCRVSSNVVNSKNRIGYLYRAKPDGDFSGWYFVEVESDFLNGNDGDFPIDFFAEMDSDLFTVAFLHPEIVRFLNAVPGSAFILCENGLYVPDKNYL